MSRFTENLKHIFFPPKCMFCGKSIDKSRPDTNLVCSCCKENLPYTKNDGCFPSYDLDSIAYTISPLEYHRGVDEAVRGLKFKRKRSYAPVFAAFMCDYLRHVPEVCCVDMVIPVPLGKQRLQERGFNQSGLIGASIAAALGLPFSADILLRIRETKRQSGLNKQERMHNVMGAFAATEALENMTILLVDDVYTTGSTAIACARALKAVGAGKIILATAAIAGQHYERDGAEEDLLSFRRL